MTFAFFLVTFGVRYGLNPNLNLIKTEYDELSTDQLP